MADQPILVPVTPRPAATNRYNRHIEELLWSGRWAYLRYAYLLHYFDAYAADSARVLSFGCGFGKHEAALAIKHPQISVTGIDIDADIIAKTQRKFASIDNARFLAADIHDHEERYDFIYTIECLEHLEDPWPIVEKLTTLTDRLLIMVPNFLERYDNPEGRTKMWRDHEHYHIGFSVDQLSDGLSRLGFSVVDGRQIYFENVTTKVRELMTHMIANYQPIVANDMKFLDLMRSLYDLDFRAATWLGHDEEGQGTAVYAERSPR